MTQEDNMRMAREAGGVTTIQFTEVGVERFAVLVAAAEQKKWEDQTAIEIHEAILDEREACKKLAQEQAAEYKVGGRLYAMLGMNTSQVAETACDHIAHLISERGQA